MPPSVKLPTLRKNTTNTSLPECLDFLSKIPSEHRIILCQDRNLAKCLFHSLLLFQADFPSIYLSHKETLHPRLKTKTFGFGSTPMKWEFGACEVFIKVFSDALLTACFRYTEWNNWWTSIKNAGQITPFFTVKCMDTDVSIFYYSGLGYIKVSSAIFCQPQFIWILMSRSRNRLHLAERPMHTEPN